MQTIRKSYPYNHVHDTKSLQVILKELSGADGVQELKEAPAPSAGAAHSVTDSVTFLHNMMMDADTDSEYTEAAYGVGTDSDSSEETHRSKSQGGRDKKKKQDGRDKKKKKKGKDEQWKDKKNTCPH